MRISDWSSDVCSSDLHERDGTALGHHLGSTAQHVERMTQHDAELPFEFLVGEFRDRLDPGDADDIDDAVYHAQLHLGGFQHLGDAGGAGHVRSAMMATRSEEHTSELQSLMRISYAVFCLKKKKN